MRHEQRRFFRRHFHTVVFTFSVGFLAWTMMSIGQRILNTSTVSIPPLQASIPVQEASSALFLPPVVPFDAGVPDALVFTSERRFRCPCNGRLLTAEQLEDEENCPCLKIPINDDRDLDGLPNELEARIGANPDDPSDAWLDHDMDGFASRDEFELGFDPGNISDHPSYRPELVFAPMQTKRYAFRLTSIARTGDDEVTAQLTLPNRDTVIVKDGAKVASHLVVRKIDNDAKTLTLLNPKTKDAWILPLGRTRVLPRRGTIITVPRLPQVEVRVDSWSMDPFELHGERFAPASFGPAGLKL